MAHKCTNCDRGFPDGSTEMLSGCPDCGENRFQYLPDADVPPEEPASSAEPDDSGSLLSAMFGRGDATDDEMIEAEPDPEYLAALNASTESAVETPAQADARSAVVSPDHLPDAPTEEARQPHQSSEDPDEEPPKDIRELREQLEDRFESIKIVDRGEYELNLMELYERRECIIELQENGRYAIEVPEALTK